MFESLLEADPGLVPVWQEFVQEWEGEPDPPIYLALSGVARYLVNELKAGATDPFPAVFDVVEQWHIRGDHFVREAASVGLLEDLQNETLHEGTQPADFEPWLRPESLRWWRKVERFWSHGELISDD